MRRATGYSLTIDGDGYRWLHYGPKPKFADLPLLETRLFPDGGLEYGAATLEGYRMRARCSGPHWVYATLYLLDGRLAGSIYESEDGTGDVFIQGGIDLHPSGEWGSTNKRIYVDVLDYVALEHRIGATAQRIRDHADYIGLGYQGNAKAVVKRRGPDWMRELLE